MKNSPRRYRATKIGSYKGPLPGCDLALRDAARLRRRALVVIERSRWPGAPGSAERLHRLATEYDQLADELEYVYGIERRPN